MAEDTMKLLDMAIKDLVKLATISNNVIVRGSFSGAMSDEVQEVLEMCKHIHNTLVEKEESSEEA